MGKGPMIKFEVKKTIAYWVEGAKYDLSVAVAMFKAKKYPYALFMGHLALEKLLKALVVKKTKAHSPFTHSLPYLLKESGIKMPESLKDKLSEFMEFHLESRYPDSSRSFYKKCTRKYTEAKLSEIEDVFKWIETKL
jgi:HEPN domain-containing protein